MLVEMMHSADVETAHQGTGVVANLAEVVENQGKMVESGERKGRRQACQQGTRAGEMGEGTALFVCAIYFVSTLLSFDVEAFIWGGGGTLKQLLPSNFENLPTNNRKSDNNYLYWWRR